MLVKGETSVNDPVSPMVLSPATKLGSWGRGLLPWETWLGHIAQSLVDVAERAKHHQAL